MANPSPENFTKSPKSIPTAPAVWASRQRPATSAEIGVRQCMLGEMRLLATVSRPDLFAPSAGLAARVNSLQGSDIYRIKDLAKTSNEWQRAAVLKQPARGDVDGQLRAAGGKMRCGAAFFVGWSDAAYCCHSSEEGIHLGFEISLMSSYIRGPCHLQWASKFTRKVAQSSLGGGGVCLQRDGWSVPSCGNFVRRPRTRRQARFAWGPRKPAQSPPQ